MSAEPRGGEFLLRVGVQHLGRFDDARRTPPIGEEAGHIGFEGQGEADGFAAHRDRGDAAESLNVQNLGMGEADLALVGRDKEERFAVRFDVRLNL